jgi:hypothetical protein
LKSDEAPARNDALRAHLVSQQYHNERQQQIKETKYNFLCPAVDTEKVTLLKWQETNWRKRHNVDRSQTRYREQPGLVLPYLHMIHSYQSYKITDWI